jgi:hypothetical protein
MMARHHNPIDLGFRRLCRHRHRQGRLPRCGMSLARISSDDRVERDDRSTA